MNSHRDNAKRHEIVRRDINRHVATASAGAAEECCSSVHQRAMNRALDILSQPNGYALDEASDQAVRAQFDGLMAGDAELPDGWKRHKVGPTGAKRERRSNRRRQAARSS